MDFYGDRRKDKKREIIREITNYLVLILAALVLAFIFVYFGFQTARVTGDSMAPTLQNEETVILSKSSYVLFSPKRYDIVKFKVVKSKTEHEYIKRIVALPKETIQIKNGVIYVNGKKLKDLPFDELITSAGIADEEFTLGEDEYFVIGDNCNNSEDSRFVNIGAVSKEDLEGKVIAILDGWKWKKIE